MSRKKITMYEIICDCCLRIATSRTSDLPSAWRTAIVPIVFTPGTGSQDFSIDLCPECATDPDGSVAKYRARTGG
jgi:hypothetical protein